jgi:Domain of unknown function (DUF4349)
MAHHGDIAMRGVSRWGWLMAPLLLTLGACAEPTNHFHAEPSVSQLAQDRSSGDGRRLEVTHQFTLRVPNAETEGIQQKHIAECIKLGCAIVSTSIDRSNEGRVSAQATIRIKPESYDAFATLLAAPPVKVIVHSQSAEDLGLTIIDTEKRIETKTLFRDRLTAMLRDQSVKAAADLITIEKELAQAQGEIEAMTAQRDSLRTRTDTVRINISYTGAAVQFGGVDLTPIYQAVSGIGQIIISSLSWMISTLAAVVPWLPIIALVWWAVRRMIRRRQARASET